MNHKIALSSRAVARMHPTWIWWMGVGAAAAGVAVFPLSPRAALVASSIGAALLGLRAIAAGQGEATGRRRLTTLALAQVCLLAATAIVLGFPSLDVPHEWKAVGMGIALQSALLAMALELRPRPPQLAFIACGAGLGAWASWALASGTAGSLGGAGVGYALSFTLLGLAGLWPRRERLLAWEPALLASGLCALLLTTSIGSVGAATWTGPTAGFALVLLALPALAVLSSPPAATKPPRPLGSALLQGSLLILLLNVAFLPLALSSAAGARVAGLTLTAFLVMTVLFEYGAVRHFARMRRAPPAPAPPLKEPVTVIVAARNEAETLGASLEANLRLPPAVRFLLVVSTASEDDTLEVARAAAARHPGRVTIHPGASGSKAGDINAAWQKVEADFVLVLDADETIDADSLARGVHAMRSSPSLGILQGRKVSRDPEGSALARFISTERRHSTSLDQPLYADRLGAGHFAGSAALIRREVPPAVGGWSEDALTEDVDFTMRVHLETDWRIAYYAPMVVRESDPVDLHQLLRQRTRWARGWAQCFARYFPRILPERKRLGTRRAFALAWMLFAAVSAPLFTLLPAMVALRLLGTSALIPLAIAIPLAVLVLPARLVSYAYGGLVDSCAPVRRTPLRIAELALHAYAWVVLGWIIQLHALYLEMAAAPKTWAITRKRAAARPDRLFPTRARRIVGGGSP